MMAAAPERISLALFLSTRYSMHHWLIALLAAGETAAAVCQLRTLVDPRCVNWRRSAKMLDGLVEWKSLDC
jgi:hypothetical protein